MLPGGYLEHGTRAEEDNNNKVTLNCSPAVLQHHSSRLTILEQFGPMFCDLLNQKGLAAKI